MLPLSRSINRTTSPFHLTLANSDVSQSHPTSTMAEDPEDSFTAAVTLLQQFRGVAQLNSRDLDGAINRQMLNAVATSISDVMQQAGINHKNKKMLVRQLLVHLAVDVFPQRMLNLQTVTSVRDSLFADES